MTRKPFDVGKLSRETRLAALARNPHARAALGFGEEPKATVAARKPSRRGLRSWVGGIAFDSAGEAECFRLLRIDNPVVFAHGKVSLTPPTTMSANGETLAADFIVGRIVNATQEPVTVTLQPGEFVGYVADYKAEWRGKTGKKKAHVERGFKVRMGQLRDWFGVVLRILTKGKQG